MKTSQRPKVLSLGLILLSLLVLFPTAQAATYNVTKTLDTAKGSCDPTDCSLREAVIAANKNPGPDTIILPRGTYHLTIFGKFGKDEFGREVIPQFHPS